MAEVAVENPDPAAADAALLERLRAGDEAAFDALVAGLYGTMLTVARTYVQDRATIRVAMRAIAELPLTQQTVIRMRDVEGYSAEEVCATLDVSEANQRVLLHR